MTYVWSENILCEVVSEIADQGRDWVNWSSSCNNLLESTESDECCKGKDHLEWEDCESWDFLAGVVVSELLVFPVVWGES